MCDNLDLKNYVDVMKLDACCKRRDTFKLVGIEVKETSSATPATVVPPSSSSSSNSSSSSSSCTSKKHVSIASHGKADGTRSLDTRNTKTEVKVVKGILRSKERETEENAREASLRKVGGVGKENERVVDECGRFPVGMILENGRRISASTNRKSAQAELENATCSAHGMKTVAGLPSSDGRTGIWGSVKAVKVSPPRMKRRKKKTSQASSSASGSSVVAPRTETRQSRLAALLANRMSKDFDSEGPMFRRRSPPRPTTVRIDTSGPRGATAAALQSGSPVFETPRKEDGRLGLALGGSEVGQAEGAPKMLLEVKGEEGLGFRGHTSAIQSSPDFTSDDTDGGGKDSGYVTMEELQAQLLGRSSSSGDEKEIECGPSNTDRQGQDTLAQTAGEGPSQKTTEGNRSPHSLLQFTFTVKLDSTLVRRRQMSLASRALTVEKLKDGGGYPPMVAGKVDVVVSELTKTVDQTEAAGISGSLQRTSQGEDVVDGCYVSRDSAVDRSRTEKRMSMQSDHEKHQLEKGLFATHGQATGSNERRRTTKASESSSDELARPIEVTGSSAQSGLRQSSPGRNEGQRTRDGSQTGRSKAAIQKEMEDEESSAKSTPDVTSWDVGTYLRPVGSRSAEVARCGEEVGMRSEAIHMSWQEVVAEAQRLGIPLDIPRQRRGRSARGHGWVDQRRSTASCDSSAESDGSLEEEEEDEEDEEDERDGGRGRRERKLTSQRKTTSSGAGTNRFGQSGGDQGAVLLKTRRTLKELLKMRNPFFGRSKKKKSRKQQQQQKSQRGDGGCCCCCDDSPPSSSTNRRRRNPSSDDNQQQNLTSGTTLLQQNPTSGTMLQQNTTSGTTLLQQNPTSGTALQQHRSQKSATCCRASPPQPCDKMAPRRPQCFDDVDGLLDAADVRDEGADMGPTTPVNCDNWMLTKLHKEAQNSTTEVILSPVFNCPTGSSNRKADFVRSLSDIQSCGWYWGQMELEEAEAKLANKPDGTFLVRDSSDDRYILSLSFRSLNSTHHTRIEHYKGMFGFHSQMQLQGVATIVDFISKAMEVSKDGRCVYYLRPRGPGLSPAPVQLLHPLSRFKCLHSLKHLCKFIIMRYVRLDLIDRLPISPRLKEYLKGSPETQ